MTTRMGQIVAVVLLVAASPVLGAAGSASGRSAESRGYRLRGYRWDAVLGQRWAVFEDAVHPEWPLVSELDPEGAVGPGQGASLPTDHASANQAAPVVKLAELVVHSGDAVTLWRDEGNVRMQLAAVAEGNGTIGGRIQLRVTGAGIFGNTGWRAVGVVRGPGSVEME